MLSQVSAESASALMGRPSRVRPPLSIGAPENEPFAIGTPGNLESEASVPVPTPARDGPENPVPENPGPENKRANASMN